MNCSKAKFYENYLTSDSHTNPNISRRLCLPVKMASETVTRSILSLHSVVFSRQRGNIYKFSTKNSQLREKFLPRPGMENRSPHQGTAELKSHRRKLVAFIYHNALNFIEFDNLQKLNFWVYGFQSLLN